MRTLLLALLLWQAGETAQAPVAVAAARQFFRYRREVVLNAGAAAAATGQACAVLDRAVYAHAGAALKDARLYAGTREVPYAITLSEATEAESEAAKVVNLGTRGGRIGFDLLMPDRAYTEVVLDLRGQNFLAVAEVAGRERMDSAATALGSYTLFDLSAQRLSRNTTLPLQEARFPVLHVELSVSAAPGSKHGEVLGPEMVAGADVPPSRDAQTVYTPVAEAESIVQKPRRTVATFQLPAHVPVERVLFGLAPGNGENFSRRVEIAAGVFYSASMARTPGLPAPPDEVVSGTIQRVRATEAGREVRAEQLSVPATLGANLQQDVPVEVEVENGDDAPLPLTRVSLEMRERKICFEVPPGAGAGGRLTLFYGDAALPAPVYDYARVLAAGSAVAAARLGPEEKNPDYAARPETARTLLERHPELLWVPLGVVCVLGVVALHSAKRMPG